MKKNVKTNLLEVIRTIKTKNINSFVDADFCRKFIYGEYVCLCLLQKRHKK